MGITFMQFICIWGLLGMVAALVYEISRESMPYRIYIGLFGHISLNVSVMIMVISHCFFNN